MTACRHHVCPDDLQHPHTHPLTGAACTDQHCHLTNSIFIGESGNIGEPQMVTLENGTKVQWPRSMPSGHKIIGLQLYDGFLKSETNIFSDFRDDEYKLAGNVRTLSRK